MQSLSLRKIWKRMALNSIKCISVAFVSLLTVFFSNPASAQQKDGELTPPGDEKFDPAKEIMGHVQDSHVFHFFSVGNFHATIPLPVIVYSKERGVNMFSSGNFGDEGTEEYNQYKLQNGEVVSTDPAVKVYDFSLTKNVVQMFLALALLVILMTGIAKKYKKGEGVTSAPSGWQSMIEPIITFLRDDVAKVNLGKKYQKYMPYLLTIFFFILINSIFGLLPGFANVSGNIAFTVVLGVISFVVILISSNKHYWGHIFWPPVPHGVKPIVIPVEIIGIFTKPFALIIRLFANMVAGHIIILSFISLIFIFGAMNKGIGWSVSPFSILFTVFIYLIEILVAFIQAFIFTNLTAVFIGQALEGGHGGDEHDEVVSTL